MVLFHRAIAMLQFLELTRLCCHLLLLPHWSLRRSMTRAGPILVETVTRTVQLRFYTRKSRDLRYRGLSMSNDEARTFGTTQFFELLDALIRSLQPRETLHQSSDLATLLQQFAFHSLVVFYVFFTVFRSHSYTEHLIVFQCAQSGHMLHGNTMYNSSHSEHDHLLFNV